MTRINVGIDPSELPTKLLLAEHREIKRIPNTIKSGKAKVSGIPPAFTLGTGHVKFFYDKLLFLKNRYISIYDECILRGCNVQSYAESFENVPIKLDNDYQPSVADRLLLIERITSKGFKLQ
jgi:hypothetical protein